MIDALQDAAVGGGMRHCAGRSKRPQFLLQGAQGLNSLGHMTDVFVEQAVHLSAIGQGLVLETQQHPHLVKRHVQAAALADEPQPVRMLRGVDAVVALRARGGRQQALAFVEADRLDGRSTGLGQFTDALVRFPSCQ